MAPGRRGGNDGALVGCARKSDHTVLFAYLSPPGTRVAKSAKNVPKFVSSSCRQLLRAALFERNAARPKRATRSLVTASEMSSFNGTFGETKKGPRVTCDSRREGWQLRRCTAARGGSKGARWGKCRNQTPRNGAISKWISGRDRRSSSPWLGGKLSSGHPP